MRGQPWLAAVLAAIMLIAVPPSSFAKKVHRHHGPDAATSAPPAPSAAPEPQSAPPAPAGQPPPAAPPSGTQNPPNPANPEPSAVVIERERVQTILGKNVRSSAGEDMGRLVDVVVDRDGQTLAAIIDFGGFLGVGSRKIAVDWKALHFTPEEPKGNTITLALTRDQVKAAPEYKDASPIVILGALGNLQTVPFPEPQEK
jgi:PRC-barrel domain